MPKFIAIVFLCVFYVSQSFAKDLNQSVSWYSQSNHQNLSLNVELFLSSTCPHCTKANQFMTIAAQEMPWLDIHRYYVNTDTDALNLLYQRLQMVDDMNFAVPAIFFCGSHWVGFSHDGESGKELIRGLNYCHERLLLEGSLTAGTTRVLNAWSKANQWQSGLGVQSSPLYFIVYTALLDFAMPCSIFALLLMLVWLGARPAHFLSMTVVLSLTFFITHYVGQVHSERYLENFSYLRPIAAIFALLWLVLICDWAWRAYKGQDRRIEMRCGTLMAIVSLTLVLAYQQTCPNNVSLVLQQWLNTQDISIKTYWAYQGLYQLMVCLPLGLMMLAYYYFLGSKKMQDKQRGLWIFNLLMMVATALILIFCPRFISEPWLPWTLAFCLGLCVVMGMRVLSRSSHAN